MKLQFYIVFLCIPFNIANCAAPAAQQSNNAQTKDAKENAHQKVAAVLASGDRKQAKETTAKKSGSTAPKKRRPKYNPLDTVLVPKIFH